MKTNLRHILTSLFAINSALVALSSIVLATDDTSKSIPFDQLGTEAGKDYKGDGLAITPTDTGANLHCDFQKLKGKLTGEGLWLEADGQESPGVPFRIVARSFGRDILKILPSTGEVETGLSLARFIRPGVVEEYSVSVDGVRQDFIVNERPGGSGQLRLELAVDGAKAEITPGATGLIADGAGRMLAYQRLQVTDATGRHLDAHMQVISGSEIQLVVYDTDAIYPVRIDPTFSDSDWVSMGSFPGTNGEVKSIVRSGSDIYVSGSFSVAGSTIITNGIAKWDGQNWTALPSGFLTITQALAVDSFGNVFAGGYNQFEGVNTYSVEKWNGFFWTTLGYGINNSILALAADSSGNVYAGGAFTTAGSVTANRMAKWNGTDWSSMGNGITGSYVAVLYSRGSDLYVGGYFSSASGITNTANLARWNGSVWSSLGSGTNNTVNAITSDTSGNIFVGGQFTTAGGVTVNRVAKWDGSAWFALNTGMNSNGTVYDLAFDSFGSLYAGGDFNTAGGVTVNRVAKWNGSMWAALGSGISSSRVFALEFDAAGKLIVGGNFPQIGNVRSINIASWNDSIWGPLGEVTGMAANLNVTAMATDLSGNLCAAGDAAIDGHVACRIQKWNGSSWMVIGSVLNGCKALVTDAAGNLFAGGDFFVRKWNGATWADITPQISYIKCLAFDPLGNLYAGGYSILNGTYTGQVSKWNGATWTMLGSGMTGGSQSQVSCLSIEGSGTLVVGGQFSIAGGVALSNIARWTGMAWAPMGSGMNDKIQSLASDGTNLYAGGSFSIAGGVATGPVARWDGSVWATLSNGLIANTITALAVASDHTLFVAGVMTAAGGNSASGLARWDGNTWSPLGSGIRHGVDSLVVSNATLYAGGSFTVAGGKVSPYIAKANIELYFPLIAVATSLPAVDGSSVIDFGVVNRGEGGTAKTFTITNLGSAGLTNLVVSLDGTNATDFMVSALSNSTVAVGSDVATFTITFSPKAGPSSRTAAIHVASNVTGTQNPFDIMLTGTANNAPSNLMLSATSVVENAPANTTVGTLSSTDPDAGDSFTYSLVSGSGSNDNAAFTITGAALKISSSPVFATKSSYAIRIRTTDSGGLFFEKPFTITITMAAVVFTDWATIAGLTGPSAALTATPFDDGVANFLKYAFNMNASGPDVSVLTPGGNAGLPQISVDTSGAVPVLRVAFLRRKGSGLIYTPQRSNSLGSFVAMAGTQTVTSINAQWERVSVEEPAPPATAPRAFARVQITLP